MKHKIILDIRNLAGEIENSNSFSTIDIKEKVSKLQEKLIILEFLESSIVDLSKDIADENTSIVEEQIQENKQTIIDTINEDTNEIIINDDIELSDKNIEKEAPIIDNSIINEPIKVDNNNQEEVSKSLHDSLETKKSLHDELKKNTVQIGLNDRIAFVKKLFGGNQQDFNRVLSQVNSFSTVEEVRDFINDYVKPEHDWENYEEYAERFIEIVESKFE